MCPWTFADISLDGLRERVAGGPAEASETSADILVRAGSAEATADEVEAWIERLNNALGDGEDGGS